jgi:hypothetical protein
MNKIESAYKEMMEDVQMSWLMIAYCMKDKALELERELTAVTEQRDEARKIATEYRNAFNEAFHDDYSSILNQLPWENNQPTEP